MLNKNILDQQTIVADSPLDIVDKAGVKARPQAGVKNIKNSDFIIPITVILHLAIINGTLFFLTPHTYLGFERILYYNVTWLLITYSLYYYPTGRKERFFDRIHKVIQLYFVYGLAYFALFGLTGKTYESLDYQFLVYGVLCTELFLFRILFFKISQRYRSGGGNILKVVVLGKDSNLVKMQKVFDQSHLGYRYHGYFDDHAPLGGSHLGKISDCFLYILENDIDEIYCVASKFNQRELKNLIDFADNNLIKFKVILDDKEIFSRAMAIESYENVPVLNLRSVPLDTPYARIMKRTFDLFFSTFVIVFILSWLTPILAILIKMESPGGVFFKQKRHGFKRKVFWCYKFRSMAVNREANTVMAQKNDARMTKIGRFLRRTNMDELPQFFNVFLGEMSVVGPRPHMELHTFDYEYTVNKYLVRHFVKPGITGLAQIKGYRGEIQDKSDILNRVRLDIFYVEKWSLGLDLEIIFQTVLNTFRGEEKAY
ncbi:MAG: exopolysaccharide biosynthesis polyprenyl glycosylphosphotransferase [Flavobacteriaceae bacterium]